MTPLHLFEGYGLELEYMIVRNQTLDILPASDRIIRAVCGSYENEVEMGPLAWSNELALHVIELKTNGPAADLDGLIRLFQDDIGRINTILSSEDGCLMPGGMHPWMDPLKETRLWPHDYNAIYEAYNRIFDCRGHGWSNLQSTHLNLPFYNDEEFCRLHAAVRLVLPLLPALAASTPIMEMHFTGNLDSRLSVYRDNQKKIPILTGDIIPESVCDRSMYEQRVLAPIYQAIAPHDPEGILQYEWLNSRGAIARFERNTIEIRVLDIQECPLADVTIVFFITQIIRALVEERFMSLNDQLTFPTGVLSELFNRCIVTAENTEVVEADYLRAFQYPVSGRSAGVIDLLCFLSEKLVPESSLFSQSLKQLLSSGSLASRILSALNGDFRPGNLRTVYHELCRCLASGKMFIPG